MQKNIHIYENAEKLYQGFSEFVTELLEGKERISISLSGGETPKALFDFWAKQNNLDWKRINFYWGDERCVPPTSPESNFGMTKQHLFDKISVSENQIFRIIGENNPAEEVARYGNVLQKNLPIHNGIPQFDLMILGLGTDGHTASIFPNQINLWDDSSNCVVAQHPESGQKRISLTGKVINNAVHVVFLTTGASKREKVKSIVENPQEYKDVYPAARVSPTSGNLHWYIDSAAAELLK